MNSMKVNANGMRNDREHASFSLDMDTDLARPEFDGRWDKQAVKQDIDPLFNRSKHWKTKMDKVRMTHSLEMRSSVELG